MIIPSDWGPSEVLKYVLGLIANSCRGEKLCICGFLCENPIILLNFGVEVFIVILGLDPSPLENSNHH